jgi:hypothetical protein
MMNLDSLEERASSAEKPMDFRSDPIGGGTAR